MRPQLKSYNNSLLCKDAGDMIGWTAKKVLPGVFVFFYGNASQSFPFHNKMELTFHLFSFCLNLCTGFCIIKWENIVQSKVGIFQGRLVFLFPCGTSRNFSFHFIFMCNFLKDWEGMHKCMQVNMNKLETLRSEASKI